MRKRTFLLLLLLALVAISTTAQNRSRNRRVTTTHKATPKTQFGPYSTVALKDTTIYVKGVPFVMVGVQGGTYTMGCTRSDDDRIGPKNDVRANAHKVAVSSFYIGQTEVTRRLWKVVMNDNSIEGYPDNPIYKKSWIQCMQFIERLNSLTGLKFRLPTEAEWEYAAKGGNKSHNYMFAGSDNFDEVARGRNGQYGPESIYKVAQMKPNELGIYDMSGNVSEWVNDWDSYYKHLKLLNCTNPQGPTKEQSYKFIFVDSKKVVRDFSIQGMYRDSKVYARMSFKDGDEVAGFRLAMEK